MLTLPLFPSRPRESKWVGILVLRTQELGVCVLDVLRAVHQGLSLREGVLAKASAVRPRATPRSQKGHTQTQRTPSRQHAHSARCTTRHATARRHSYIHTMYKNMYMHKNIHARIHACLHTLRSDTQHARHAHAQVSPVSPHARLYSRLVSNVHHLPDRPPWCAIA